MRLLALVLLLTAGAFGQTIEEVVREAIAAGKCPGAVVLVGKPGAVWCQAFGQRAVKPTAEPMNEDTVFDLASLTKVVCTAPCIMQLVEQGRLRLNDPLSRFIALEDPQARLVTIQDLLVHLSGFRGGLDRTRPWQGLAGAEAEIARERLQHPPGTHFEYSDINYIALGLVVQKVTGQRLDEYARDHLFGPLGMQNTRFGPVTVNVAPTQERGGEILRGTVHDHVSGRMGGVSGHAGVFSTAQDLAIFCQAILEGGKGVLAPATVARMARPVVVSEAGWTRGLGWDIDTSFSSNRGELFPKGSFGHTGWTGTSLWIDPVSQAYVVFLSNRVHPDGTGDVTPLRARVATLAAASLKVDAALWRQAEQGYAAQVTAALPEFLARVRQAAPAPAGAASLRTLNGIDILAEDGYRQVKGLRLGLVTNQTGRSRQGQLTADLLRKNAQLVRIYSPEHGFLGVKDEAIADSVYEGIPVVSLYGERKRPSDLQGLDALVFDIQDCGARFYTYSATLRFVMEEAARARLPVIVLDRPNPIDGVDVEGPVADPSPREPFTCPHTLPVRHGMTMGELARMFNEERGIGCDLRVVQMDPWTRGLWFDQTQQTWVNPSPNLRSLPAAALYPGVGLLEATNLSVGRGTDCPFEMLGAPWLDGPRLAAMVNAAAPPGVRLMPVRFTPTSSKFAGQECGGVQLMITDRARLRPVRLGLELACALLRLHPQEWETAALGRLFDSEDTVRRILAGETPGQIEESWQKGLADFKARRAKFLIYK